MGKTYLIRTYLAKQINFQYSGLHSVETEVQLQYFTKALSAQLNGNIPLPTPADWFTAFELMQSLLQKKMRQKKVFSVNWFVPKCWVITYFGEPTEISEGKSITFVRCQANGGQLITIDKSTGVVAVVTAGNYNRSLRKSAFNIYIDFVYPAMMVENQHKKKIN